MKTLNLNVLSPSIVLLPKKIASFTFKTSIFFVIFNINENLSKIKYKNITFLIKANNKYFKIENFYYNIDLAIFLLNKIMKPKSKKY